MSYNRAVQKLSYLWNGFEKSKIMDLLGFEYVVVTIFVTVSSDSPGLSKSLFRLLGNR